MEIEHYPPHEWGDIVDEIKISGPIQMKDIKPNWLLFYNSMKRGIIYYMPVLVPLYSNHPGGLIELNTSYYFSHSPDDVIIPESKLHLYKIIDIGMYSLIIKQCTI